MNQHKVIVESVQMSKGFDWTGESTDYPDARCFTATVRHEGRLTVGLESAIEMRKVSGRIPADLYEIASQALIISLHEDDSGMLAEMDAKDELFVVDIVLHGWDQNLPTEEEDIFTSEVGVCLCTAAELDEWCTEYGGHFDSSDYYLPTLPTI